jgi:hypothetical protein
MRYNQMVCVACSTTRGASRQSSPREWYASSTGLCVVCGMYICYPPSLITHLRLSFHIHLRLYITVFSPCHRHQYISPLMAQGRGRRSPPPCP